MFVSFLAGYFKYIFILLLLIIIHEIGHLFVANILGYKINEVIIFPFGGLTKYDEYLNGSMLKELLVLLGGPLFQILFYILILILYKNNFITDFNFNIISILHKTLLCFNFLPIIPLDGSKLLNLFLQLFISYKKSNIILIIISFISIFILVIYEKRLIIIFLAFILIKTIIEEIYLHNVKFNKFLLERYLHYFNFKKGKLITNISNIKRSKEHDILYNNKIYTEKEYLNHLYKTMI